MNTTNYELYKVGNPTYQPIFGQNSIESLLQPGVIKNDNVTNFVIIIENPYSTAKLGGQITVIEQFQFSSASSKIIQVFLGLLVSIPGLIVTVILVIITIGIIGGIVTYYRRKNWSELEKEQRASLVNQNLSDDEGDITVDTQLEELNENEVGDVINEDDEQLKKSLLEIAQSKTVEDE